MKDKKSLIIIILCLFAIIFGDRMLKKPAPENPTENIGEIQIEEPTPNEEILNLTLETPAFQIGDTILYLNKATLQDFVNAGGELELGYGFTHLDSMMEHGEDRVGVKYKNAKFLVDLVNNTGSDIPVKESIINSIHDVKNKEIIISSGIMIGDTFNSIMEKTNNGLEEYHNSFLPSMASSTQLMYSYKDLILIFNKESLTLEEFIFNPLNPRINYLSDLNQITENSWDKIKELYFNTDLSRIDAFNTNQNDTQTRYEGNASLTNITPKKAFLLVQNPNYFNSSYPYNALVIMSTGDIVFSETNKNLHTGVYIFCHISNLVISEQGDINLTNYDKFSEVSTNAWYEEKDLKEYAVFHLNYAPNLKNYIWYELELNW